MPDADLILDHGTVVTLDRASHIAEALAIRDCRTQRWAHTPRLRARRGRGRGGSS
jgi:predicted amidohydrolase YtcJ